VSTFHRPGVIDIGNIKPSYIKRVALQLLRDFPEEFTFDLEENKKKVTARTNIKSKNIRNRVTGYLTRHKKIQERKPKVKESI